MCRFETTVYGPAVELEEGPYDLAHVGGGYKTLYFFVITDQFGEEITSPLPFNEWAGTSTPRPDYPGTNWTAVAFPPVTGIIIEEEYPVPDSPAAIPHPVDHTHPDKAKPVIRTPQEYYIGSLTRRKGVLVKSHTIEHRLGQARQIQP